MKEKISGYYLDSQQEAIVLDESKYLLVVAGAGSGKTLTILGKIYYLVTVKKINPNEILCISFTKKASTSLKEKIETEFHLDMPVFTFHKLSLELLKESKISYEVADANLLDDIIHEFFKETILNYPKQLSLFFSYFKVKPKKKKVTSYLNFYQKNDKQIKSLEKLLSTFIHLLKCNGYELKDFPIFLKEAKKTFSFSKYKREKILLMFALNIYLIYYEYLEENKEIDFDDMIIKATNFIETNTTSKKYRYIIIDEYQDSSYIRFKLIQKLLEKTKANLMVVGDDFQSIYRFTGCDLSLFLDFQNYFPSAKIMKIENTYRNSQELINVAGRFVMKNKKQIKKDLHSKKRLESPIRIVYYDNIQTDFEKLVLSVYQSTKKPILILGRNNKDIFEVLNQNFTYQEDGSLIYEKDKNVKLYYLTVHKSKGLEEENVILINLENKLLGFPNQIKDDKLLRFVSKNYENYPYSEERRLFYVGLTRTKNYVYLLTPKENTSIFVQELVKHFSKQIYISKKSQFNHHNFPI